MGAVGGLCGAGTLIYMIVDKSLLSRGEKATAASTEKDNQQKDVDTGLKALDMYKEVREIVKEEQKPLLEELTAVKEHLRDIQENYCCYRDKCDLRIRNKRDAENAITLATFKKR